MHFLGGIAWIWTLICFINNGIVRVGAEKSKTAFLSAPCSLKRCCKEVGERSLTIHLTQQHANKFFAIFPLINTVMYVQTHENSGNISLCKGFCFVALVQCFFPYCLLLACYSLQVKGFKKCSSFDYAVRHSLTVHKT